MLGKVNNKGFTLIELSLSMSFIAVLLLGIALLTIQIGSIYNKGITVRQVDQAGQQISTELQRSLNIAAVNSVEYVNFPGNSGGRLCVEGVVYAWNFPRENEAFESSSSARNVISNNTDIRFVKFAGTKQAFCDNSDPVSNTGRHRKDLPTSATELLSAGDNNIALRSLDVEQHPNAANDGRQTIYELEMLLGTTETAAIDGASQTCNHTDKLDDERCAINKFMFTARAGNREDN